MIPDEIHLGRPYKTRLKLDGLDKATCANGCNPMNLDGSHQYMNNMISYTTCKEFMIPDEIHPGRPYKTGLKLDGLDKATCANGCDPMNLDGSHQYMNNIISYTKEFMIPDDIHQGRPYKTRLKLYG